jgi:hypothetical protein
MKKTILDEVAFILKQRSTKHTYKTKDRVTRTPVKTGDERRCSGRVAVPAPLMAIVVLI